MIHLWLQVTEKYIYLQINIHCLEETETFQHFFVPGSSLSQEDRIAVVKSKRDTNFFECLGECFQISCYYQQTKPQYMYY